MLVPLGNIRSVLFFLLGDSLESEFSVPTFRNSLSVLSLHVVSCSNDL